MKKILTGGITAFAFLLLVGTASASTPWFQGFETDTSGWFDSSSSWYGTATQVPSGTNGITSSEGSYHAIFEGDSNSAPFSRFDMYRDTWTGDWTAEIDVYLDPNWSDGGFDYSVAATGSDGSHQRDYIFHAGIVEDYGPVTGKALLVNGSNNADFTTNPYKLVNDNDGNYYEVSTAGWYTLQHHFYNDGGSLSVDLNLIDSSNNVVWTATRSNVADTIPTEVGGNRYSWFTHIDVSGGIAVDNHKLTVTDPDTEAPVVEITAPVNEAILNGLVDITGSVTDNEELSHYNLSLYPASTDLSDGDTHSGDRIYSGWCSGTVNLSSDFTGTFCDDWDTSVYADGEYQIRLAARDAAGNRDTSDPYTGGASSVHVVKVFMVNNNIAENANQCKKGGWESLNDHLGNTFKNQGDCVSYVSTDGKNLGAGPSIFE